MEDKTIMNTLLTMSKNICGILMHGSIESSTPKIKKCFKEAFSDYIDIQGSIYKLMEKEGWYKIENTSESKINKTKNKYININMN